MSDPDLSYQHPRTGEWAHDVRDPLGEARFSFVEPAAALRPPAGPLHRILEVGFGRGLNTAVALALLAEAGYSGALRCLGLEPFPDRLLPWPPVPAPIAATAPWWGREPGPWACAGRPGWRGEVLAAPAPEALPSGWGADWIFLDLHSPGAHPEDWKPGLVTALTAAAAPGAVLTSYCCARSLRDPLAAAGWRVERLRQKGRRDRLRAQFPKGGGGGAPAEA